MRTTYGPPRELKRVEIRPSSCASPEKTDDTNVTRQMRANHLPNRAVSEQGPKRSRQSGSSGHGL